jgi:excisionase family DNA binding protein
MQFRQRLLTLVEVAALLQISTAIVKRSIKRGELVARRLGQEYRVAPPDLARFLIRNSALHKVEAAASEAQLLSWLQEAIERLRPRYSPPELEYGRSGGESFARDEQ